MSPSRPCPAGSAVARVCSPARAGGHLRAAGSWCCSTRSTPTSTFALAAAGLHPPLVAAGLAEPGRARRAVRPRSRSALVATASRCVLGTLAAIALRRTRFFGRNVVSLLIILPIALPGIVTGIALNNALPHDPRHRL